MNFDNFPKVKKATSEEVAEFRNRPEEIAKRKQAAATIDSLEQIPGGTLSNEMTPEERLKNNEVAQNRNLS